MLFHLRYVLSDTNYPDDFVLLAPAWRRAQQNVSLRSFPRVESQLEILDLVIRKGPVEHGTDRLTVYFVYELAHQMLAHSVSLGVTEDFLALPIPLRDLALLVHSKDRSIRCLDETRQVVSNTLHMGSYRLDFRDVLADADNSSNFALGATSSSSVQQDLTPAAALRNDGELVVVRLCTVHGLFQHTPNLFLVLLHDEILDQRLP
mmetsp:Transcript_112336/g.296617  ORF Transcript_112336/g.296617 Transcript_112336/m.296617 type:complete len:205 (+) Transcript_112336:2127-2741(+)